jgi:hypothetical protein
MQTMRHFIVGIVIAGLVAWASTAAAGALVPARGVSSVAVSRTTLNIAQPPPDPALVPQGPFSPWYGSVTKQVALIPGVGQAPVSKINTDSSGQEANGFVSLRSALWEYMNTPTPTWVYWDTPLCEQIFQAIHQDDSSSQTFVKGADCYPSADGTLTAARTSAGGLQCLDFEYLVTPNEVSWVERASYSVFSSDYNFVVSYQLDLRFELCNHGIVDASDPTSAPVFVNTFYNPDHLFSCTASCGVTVMFKNVSASHQQLNGTFDLIGDGPGNAATDQSVVNGFTSHREILDPKTLGGGVDDMNAGLRAGANAAWLAFHTDPRFVVDFSVNDNVDTVPIAYSDRTHDLMAAGLYPGEQIPGELHVELIGTHYAILNVSGGTGGCNNIPITSGSVRITGVSFSANHSGLFRVHDATRSFPNVLGVFYTDAQGGFDTGTVAITAQPGDRIEVTAGDGTHTATAALDPISSCS